MAALDLDDTEQPIDPKLVLAIEMALRAVSITPVEFVSAPRAWAKSNPQGSVKGPSGDRKAAIKLDLAKRHGAHCAYCGREFVDLDDATLDHVIPNSVVRHWQPWNLVLACSACNNAKGDRVPAVLMPLICHLLRELAPLAAARREAQSQRSEQDLIRSRIRKDAKKARKARARFYKAMRRLNGDQFIRRAIEAPKPRLALPAGGQA